MSEVDFSALSPEDQNNLLKGPALSPPPGVTPDFENPPNNNGLAHFIFSFFFALGSAFVLIRAYSTWFYVKKQHISDYLMIPAYAHYLAFITVLYLQVNVGYFVHQWNFRLEDVPRMFFLFNLATNLFAVTIMLIKAAILLEWLRIFVPTGTRNRFYWISMALLVIDVLFYSAAIITVNLTCIPHEKIWNRLLPGKCIESRPLDITSAAINFVIDIAILVLPQKIIWGLNMSLKKRLGVAGVFAVGLTAVIAAGIRLAVTVQYSQSADITYDFCTVGIWVVVESTCALIVFCVPAVPKALVGLGIPKLISTIQSWTAHKSTNRPKDSDSEGIVTWGQSGRKLPRPGPYEHLEGDQGDHSNNYGSDIGLATWDSPCKEPTGHMALTQSAILRTTEVTTTSTNDESFPHARDRFSHQHPWAQNSDG